MWLSGGGLASCAAGSGINPQQELGPEEDWTVITFPIAML